VTTSVAETARTPAHLAKELIASNGFLLARIGLGFKSKVLAKLDEAGFDPYHYSSLVILDERPRQTQAMMADACALDPSRLVAVLDSLEERSLIERKRDPEDRRRHIVTITPAGKRQLARLREIVKELEDEFFGALDATERKQLHELLVKVAADVDPRCAFYAKPAA